MRTCKHCGDEFEPHKKQIYCSKMCLKGATAIKKKQWVLKKRSTAHEQAKCKCQQCGSEFQPKRFYLSSREKFCSKFCGTLFHKDKKLDNIKKDADLSPRECEHCHEKFTPTWNTNHKRQKFCSDDCKVNFFKDQESQKRAEVRANTKRVCPICETEFSPKKSLKEIYCSPRCQKCIGRKVYKMLATCYASSNTKKADHSHKVLGYTPNELLSHLQSFPQWNALKNKSWHLDHVFPIIAFVRKGITDIKLICCLENLQPLAGQLNCQKNDDYDILRFENWLAEKRSQGWYAIF